VKPFLKWPGNKYNVRNQIMQHLPYGNRYVEPFVGAGGIYSQADYLSYWINDLNEDLMNVYTFLEVYGELFINACESQFHEGANKRSFYETARNLFNRINSRHIQKSVLFVYLNRHCYNGLCRYNSKGGFNTPFGKYDKPYFPRTEMLEWRNKLLSTKITVLDFEEVLSECGEGDVVYLDPPYYPSSSTANFVGYTYGWKHDKDHKRLLASSQAASKRGAHVVISNSATDTILKMYGESGGTVVGYDARQSIAANGAKRGKRSDLTLILRKS
jgi:DNA adenine methylase